MGEMSMEEAEAEIFGPHTIYAPDGTTFVAQMKLDAETAEHAFDPARIQYEVRGPGETGTHLWLSDREGELLSNPAGTDPIHLRVKAAIALQGWIRMKNELAEHLF